MNNDHDSEGGRRLSDLYREAGPQLTAYFIRRHRSPHVAEDLLHSTFAAVMKHPERLLSSNSPRGYLFGIARNLSNEMHRGKCEMVELPDEQVAEDSPPADPRLERMKEAIAGLDSGFREVLELRLQQELSYQDISLMLAIPVGTVRSRLHHAVLKLRQEMDRRESQDENRRNL